MNVLEKILEEIESLHTKILRDKFAKQVTEQEIDALVKAKQIIRSHMNEGKDLNVTTNDWITVSERLPEDGETVLVTVHTSEWISDYCSVFISDDEKIHHPESYNVYIGRLKNDGWIYFDETGLETYCCEKFGADKGVVYDVVIAWIPLPEPYKGDCNEKRKN